MVISALAVAAYSSGLLHASLRRAAVTYLSRRTGVECGIGRLGGDLFASLDVYDFYVANGPSLEEDGPAFSAKEIHLRYHLPALLYGVLLIEKARVVNPYVRVELEPGGRANFEHIFDFLPERREADIDIRLRDIVLEDGSFELDGDGPLTDATRIDVRSSLEYVGTGLTLTFGDCSCYLPEYDLAVKAFGNGEIRINPDNLTVDGFDITLDQTSLTLDGTIETSPSTRFDLAVKADPLSLTEIIPLVTPNGPPLDIRGPYEGTIRGPADELVHTGTFHCPLGSLADYDLADLTVRYAVDLEPKLIRVEEISAFVNGLPAHVTGTVDVATEEPSFEGEVHLDGFNLARLYPDAGLETRADVTALFAGSGFSPAELELTAAFTVSPGFAGPVRFDGATATVHYGRSQLFIDESTVRFGPGTLSAKGTATRDNVELAVTARDIPLAELPTRRSPVDLDGLMNADLHLYGAPRTPSAEGEVLLEGLAVEDVTVKWARLDGYAEKLGGRGKTDLHFTAGDVAAGPFSFDHSRADLNYDGRVLTVDGGFENGADDGDRLYFDVRHDSSSGDWELDRLDVRLGNAQATLTHPLRLEREGRLYVIMGGVLAFQRGDVSFSGSFDRRGGPVDVVAKGEDFHLDGLRLWPTAPELTGSLDSIRVGIRGTSDAPAFYAALEAHELSVDRQPIDLLRGEISLENDRIVIPDLTLKVAGGAATATADVPLAAFEGEGDAPLKGEVRVTGVPLNSVVVLSEAGLSEGGNVDGVVTLKGTAAAPVVRAELDVGDAVWENVRYSHSRLDVSYGAGELNLRELSLAGGNSTNANVNGVVALAFDNKEGLVLGALALEGDFEELDLRLFNPLLDNVLITGGTATGSVDVGGSASSPELTGRIELAGGTGTIRELRSTFSDLRGTIDLTGDAAAVSEQTPVVFDLDGGRGTVWGSVAFEGGRPAAVDVSLNLENYTFRAITGARVLTDVTASLSGPAKHPFADVEIYVRRGFIATDFGAAVYTPQYGESPIDYRLHVDAPGNLWLRNNTAEMELEADLTLRKTGPATTITGELTAKRGSFYILARDFVIERGGIYFTGTRSFDPALKIRAKRLIRATRPGNADAEILVDVTGTFTEPEMDFIYNSKGAAVGLTQNEISQLLVLDVTYEDFQEMSGGALASKGSGDYVRRLAQAEVSRTVRKTTGLDVFEFEASSLGAERGTRYRRATLGKYLLSDVYVSYTTEYTEDVTGAGESERSAEINYRLYEDFYLVGSTFEDRDHQQYGLGFRFFFKY
ncbi:MAG: translocation/assembly module TamB domain-containing protein [Candidatus Zixiibacteriota bacterium]